MRHAVTPTISVVLAAYQSERWIADALESILGQSAPPDEVIVVDDGSTDGTARELACYADRIRVIRRANGGCPAAHNTGFAAARGDFVALCGADDVWAPDKLERQLKTLALQPSVDVLFGHATLFGRIEGEHARPSHSGLLDGDTLRADLFRENSVCAPSVVIRRSLFERLGPFVEDFGADDYEYWFRCLRAGARFFYDPRSLLGYRQHGDNLSARRVLTDACTTRVRLAYRRDVRDPALVRSVLARELFRLGRGLVDEGRPAAARTAFWRALRFARGAPLQATSRAVLWVVVLSLPGRVRVAAGETLVRLSRATAGRADGDQVLA